MSWSGAGPICTGCQIKCGDQGAGLASIRYRPDCGNSENRVQISESPHCTADRACPLKTIAAID